MSLRMLGGLACALFLFLPVRAMAQDLEEDQAAATETEETEAPSGELGAPSDQGDENAIGAEHSFTDPHEVPDHDYFALGVFYREVFIPSFIQQLFVNSTLDAANPGVGLQFNYRRNNLNVIVDAWWNGAMGSGYFRGLGKPAGDEEFVNVNLGLLFVSVELLWAFPITDWFAIDLGFDLGIGAVYGSLTRSEAYDNPAGSASGWQACSGPGQPAGGLYCEAGGQYNYAEPNWTGGGSVPVIFPWVSLPHVALRFNPIRQIQIRVDGGYALYGFFVGGSVAYGWE